YAYAVIAVSEKMKEDLTILGCNPKKIGMAPYGPATSFFNLEPDYKIPQFITVGRFVDKKAPYLTIIAFSKVVQNYPNAKLIMVGDGPLLNTCVNLVAAMKQT